MIHSSLCKHYSPRTQTFNCSHVMAHKQKGASFSLAHFVHFAKAFLLKLCIPYRQHFIDNEDFRFEVRCHREGQPHFHTAAVVFDRSVEKFFDAAEINDGIELLPDLCTAHPEDGTIEVNILAAR